MRDDFGRLLTELREVKTPKFNIPCSLFIILPHLNLEQGNMVTQYAPSMPLQ
jgi:hypothetical protein